MASALHSDDARRSSGFETATSRCRQKKVVPNRARRRCVFSLPRATSNPTADSEPVDSNPKHIIIIGAGFAGVATAYHVFKQVAHMVRDAETSGTSDGAINVSPIKVTLIDEKAIAGGASGVAAGLLHPYTPRGKIIWRGVEGVAATLELVTAAEEAEAALKKGTVALPPDVELKNKNTNVRGRKIAHRAGVCRPARSLKQARDLAKFAAVSYGKGGKGVAVDVAKLTELIPNINVPDEVVDEMVLDIETTKTNNENDEDETDYNKSTPSESSTKQVSRSSRKAMIRKQKNESNASVTAGLHIPEGLVLDTTRYLSSLWDATKLLAFSEETPSGCSARMEIRTVTGLGDDSLLDQFDSVIVACGAAAGSVAELSGNTLPTQLQGGHVVEMVPKKLEKNENNQWPTDAPGVLGSPYIAPLGPGRLLVGTTKEYDVTVEDARRAGVVELNHESIDESKDDELSEKRKRARDAGIDLVKKASDVYPPLGDVDTWRIDVTRYGVRANPPRSNLGSLPLVGRISVGKGGERNEDSKDVDKSLKSWWYVGGLGARGLVYHGMLGKIVARCVLEDDDRYIPTELRFDPGSDSLGVSN